MRTAALSLMAALAFVAPAFAQTAAKPAAAMDPRDWRPVDAENTLVLETTKGTAIIELYPDIAPGHVARIKELAKEGFYDGTNFHRVIDGFMAQGGDPKGDGTGGSTKPDLVAEFNYRRGTDVNFAKAVDRGGATFGYYKALPVMSQPDALIGKTRDGKVTAWGLHCPGVLSMARASEPNSANSQFFFMRDAYPSLDRNYTIWGKAIIGADVARKMKTGEPVVDPDKIVKARILVDIPAAERPQVVVQRGDGPSFQAALAAAMKVKGPAFSVCDIAPEGRQLR